MLFVLKGFSMSIDKYKFRELVFQLLFSNNFMKVENEDEIISFMMKKLKVTRKNVKLAVDYVNEILEKKDFIDGIIKKQKLSHDFDRISKVELNVIRLAVFELFFKKDLDHKIIISEAIRLCKKFSTKNSVSFINAIVDSIYKKKDEYLREG